MIRVVLFDAATSTTRFGDESLLAGVRDNQRSLMWLDMQDISEADEQKLVTEQLGLPLQAIQALQQFPQPMADDQADHLLLRLDELQVAASNQGDAYWFELRPLGFLFADQRWLITRHAGPSECVNTLWEELQKNPSKTFDPNVIATRLGGMMAVRYLNRAAELDKHLTLLEQRLSATAEPGLEQQLLSNKDALNTIVSTIKQHVQIFDTLDQLNVDIKDEVRMRLLALEKNLQRALKTAQR